MRSNWMKQWHDDVQHHQKYDCHQWAEIRYPGLSFNQMLIEWGYQWKPYDNDARQITINLWTNWFSCLSFKWKIKQIKRGRQKKKNVYNWLVLNIPESRLKQLCAPYQLWYASQRILINYCAVISAHMFDRMFPGPNYHIPSEMEEEYCQQLIPRARPYRNGHGRTVKHRNEKTLNTCKLLHSHRR